MSKKNGLLLLFLMALVASSGCAANKRNQHPAMDTPFAETEAVDAYRNGDSAKSLALYRELLAADPGNPVCLNNMGVLLLEAGQAEEALKAFESASLQAPGNADHLANIGFAHLRLGNNDESLTFFNRAIQLAPEYARGHYGKGVAFMELGETEIALGAFREAVALAPADGENLFMKAYAEQKSGLWLDAVNDYSAYLMLGESNRQQANAFSNRALCAFKLGQYDQGMADLRNAMELDDSVAVYYYNRALGYQMQQKYETAVDDYTRAISRHAEFPEAYINRGELHFLLGNDEKGCSDLGRACGMGFCENRERYEAAGICK